MFPIIVGAVALAVLSRESRGSNPNQLIIELDTMLPPPDVDRVIRAIREVSPQTVGQLDAMSAAYRQRGMPLTAYELDKRAWDVRGRQGPPPAPPHPDAAGAPGMGRTSPPIGCLDAAADPAMCQAVTGALLTETNPDKLHAFAETVRAQYPQAAEALDSKAAVFGWGGGPSRANGHATSGRANGHGQAHATGGNGASRPGAAHAHATGQAPAERPWVQVASDMSNVPRPYHGALASMMMQLGRDESMTPGTERAVQVGDKMFVFVKPPPAPNAPPGTVWITRMSVGADEQSAATGYGSGPLWPSDIVDGRMVPPDRRYMGSPTIWDPATSILSPPAPVQTVLEEGPPGPAVETVYVGAEGWAGATVGVSGGEGSEDVSQVPMHVPPSSLAAEVASMPQGVAFGQGGGVPGIMGASRPEIVSSGQAAAEEAAKDGMPMMMEAELAAEARPRPRPSVYVKLRHGDSVWPVKLAKIGSGNKSSFDQLVAMNPHLVSPSGAWAQMFPGDEVCIPPVWAENLRARGFLIKSDFAGE